MAQERIPDFAGILRRSRQAAGISQEELAARSGLSARAISDLERGVNRAPRRDTLEMLADALELSDDERKTWERLRRTLVTRIERERAASRTTRSSATREHPDQAIHHSNVPRPLTPLIGREQEIATLTDWLRDDTGRIVTLVGSGGTGKTRLAIDVGIRSIDEFADGVYFADLAPITDPSFVMRTVAGAIGVRHFGQHPLQLILRETLRDKSVLLIVDNLEQVLDAASELSSLAASCPHLRILATSRAPLRVRGEREFPVTPLEMPDLSATTDVALTLRNVAVRLFEARARDVRPDFAVTPENIASVATVCVRLDGLPLAIELAAARIKLMTPQAMLPLMEHRMTLLTSGPRDLPARQQTLRDTIDWSYNLLEPADQRLFRQLAVFAGGWTVEAAAAICDSNQPEDTSVERRSVSMILSQIGALIDHSLVRRTEQPDGSTRFTMLETLREYGRDRLIDHDELDELRERHATHFFALAEQTAPFLDADDPIPYLDRLAIEHDNLRAALEWFQTSGDVEHGLCMVGHLREFWHKRGFVSEGRAQARGFLNLPNPPRSAPCRTEALTTAAWLALRQNDPEAIRHATEALEILRSRGDETTLPRLLSLLGVAVDNLERNLERSNQYHEQSLVVARRLGDMSGASMALACLGATAYRQGNHDRAEAVLDECIRLATATGSTLALALALGVVALMALDAGNSGRALELHQERLRLYVQLDDIWGVLRTLHNLARVALARNLPETAARLMANVATQRDRSGLLASPWDQPILDSMRFEMIDRLGLLAFETAWATGAGMPVNDAIAEALALRPSDGNPA